MRPNWFFGFPIDGAFLRELPEVPDRIRCFHPEDVHMTLAFLGGCGEEAALRALAALDRELERAPILPLAVSFGEVVPMGARRRYTALSALLETGRSEAEEVLTELGGLLCEVGIGRRPTRPAKPHITLARPRPRAPDSAREAGLAWAKALDLRGVRQTLARVALYTWHADRKERLFRIVAERPLDRARGG